MYRRHSAKTTIYIILSCLLYIGFEFGIYYFTDSAVLVFTVAALGSLILTHLFLESTLTYDTCFLLILCSVVPTSIISLLIYFNQTGHLLVYHSFLPYLVLFHWLLPLLYCTFRSLMDRSPRFVRYNSFFLRTGILFALYYFPALLIRSFFIPLEFPYTFTGKEISLIPFMATATHIEDFIYTGIGLQALLIYLVRILFLFFPLGFYGTILLKQAAFPLKVFLCLFLPAAIEGGVFLLKGSFMIDACIFRLFGIISGVLFYRLLNRLFQHYTHEEFLYERNRYSFFN